MIGLFLKLVNLTDKNLIDQVVDSGNLGLLRQITSLELLNREGKSNNQTIQTHKTIYKTPWMTTTEVKHKTKCQPLFKIPISWKICKKWKKLLQICKVLKWVEAHLTTKLVTSIKWWGKNQVVKSKDKISKKVILIKELNRVMNNGTDLKTF